MTTDETNPTQLQIVTMYQTLIAIGLDNLSAVQRELYAACQTAMGGLDTPDVVAAKRMIADHLSSVPATADPLQGFDPSEIVVGPGGQTMADAAALEALRAFATAHNELAFAHLVTAAIQGETWAIKRVAPALTSNAPSEGQYLGIIRAIDTTRPDGATARSIEV